MTHKFLQVCSLQRALECGRRCFHAPPIWLPKLALHRMPASLATSDCGRTTLTPFERRPPAIALSVPSWGLPSKDHSTAATSPAESVALTTSSRLAAKVSSWRLHEKPYTIAQLKENSRNSVFALQLTHDHEPSREILAWPTISHHRNRGYNRPFVVCGPGSAETLLHCLMQYSRV